MHIRGPWSLISRFAEAGQRVRRFVRRDGPTAIIKKSDHVNYMADLLDRIQLPFVRMHEVCRTDHPCCYLRHDVDYDIERALSIAWLESKRGFSSTYFLLTPGAYDHQPVNYYGELVGTRVQHHSRLIDRCKRLVDLGHDIGFHNDLVALALKTGLNPRQFLEEELAYFDRHGIRVRGTAAHGNPLARQLSFNNREIFAGCIRQGWEPGRSIGYNGRSVTLHSLQLEEFNLEYEAYSLPRDSRISDSGGYWAGKIAGQRLPKDEWRQNFDIVGFRDLVDRAHETSMAFSVLTHPVYWNDR